MAVMLALGMPLTYDRKGMVKVIKPQASSSQQAGIEEGFFSAMLADRNKDDVCHYHYYVIIILIYRALFAPLSLLIITLKEYQYRHQHSISEADLEG